MNFYVMDADDPFRRNKRYFQNQLSEYVFYSKYSRWDDESGRRETWEETVRRATDYLKELSEGKLGEEEYERIYRAILNQEVMPSMRLLAMAGKAARSHPISIFNCAGTAMDSIDAIVEVMYLSMNGVGVGFSVERRFTDRLPTVQRQQAAPRGKHEVVVSDSTEGWCDALKTGLNAWWHGHDVAFDFSHVRPAGAVLRTKGGTSSGPGVLDELLTYAREKVLSRQGKKLRPIDVYDLVTKIADCVVMGGVRRSALLCLFDLNDQEMMEAKNGNYWETEPHRANANNSAVWEKEMTYERVSTFFDVMHKGLNGEPGFFSRYATHETLPDRRDATKMYGTNACGEAVLRIGENGGGLCNLTQVVARSEDTLETLSEKARIAAIIGTIQTLATNFNYLRSGWQRIAEEERLLGVDMTGHWDCEAARNWENQTHLKGVVIATNEEYADRLGINRSAATTLVKPSGNSGTLLDVSSGVHPRWSKFYKRNVRMNVDSPLFYVLQQSGFPMVEESEKTWVAGFAVKSPEGAVTRDALSAEAQLAYWKQVKLCYAEHSVSMTCYYAEDELDYVKQWVYENQRVVSGLSFLPRNNAHYENAPYEEIDEAQYHFLHDSEPAVDYARLAEVEQYDLTEASHEVGCSAGQCDLEM